MPVLLEPAFGNMTTTVQYVMDQCKLHTKLQNYFGVGQITGEPGCGIANRVNQMLLQRRMPWKFNRVELGPTDGNFMVTQQGIQDMRFAGATAFVLLNNQGGSGTLPCGGVGIDLANQPVNGGAGGITIAGSVITVQTLDPHPFTSANVGTTLVYLTGVANPNFNSNFSYTQLTQTSAWTNGFTLLSVIDKYHFTLQSNNAAQLGAAPTGAPGIGNLGWLESASIQDINSTAFPQPVKPIQAVHRISPEYTTTGDELMFCALIDYNNGVIKFRLSEPMGTYCFQINAVYQARAPKLSTAKSIFRWPDDLSFVLVEMALWQASRFAYGLAAEETMKFQQSAQQALMSALEAEDKEDNVQGITPEWSLMR
jgi:hypothetical protein